jgi:hypothetical protein
MALRRIPENLQTAYLENLRKYGEQVLYQRSVGQGMILLVENPDIDSLLLDYSDAFFVLYRKTGEEDYFVLGKVLRRAAHVIYRQIMKQDEDRKLNRRFLNIVQ